MFDLYTWPTPNGRKVSILLEELEVDYNIIPIDIDKFVDFFIPIIRRMNIVNYIFIKQRSRKIYILKIVNFC